ncbi:hypothetical protein CHARACLAT_019197 [Characodon lateralis]|uniref:Uncharacterized protein n=1 Tax=Characodon lateralis TaxID=208331 RepID=A0ABU7E1S3_9TELE|nr:hypothetical protein [Characodon lateralis]
MMDVTSSRPVCRREGVRTAGQRPQFVWRKMSAGLWSSGLKAAGEGEKGGESFKGPSAIPYNSTITTNGDMEFYRFLLTGA